MCLFYLLLITLAITKAYDDVAEEFETIQLPGLTINGSLYLSTYRATRAAALYDCYFNFFGSLLAISSREDDKLLQDFIMENSGVTILTSGYKESNGLWYWSTDLSLFSYTNWAPNHPAPSYGCLVIGGLSHRYAWYSARCSTPTRFICVV